MELRKDYEEIRSRAIQGLCVPANQVTVGTVIDAVREAVTACQELADRPPRELTDAEIGDEVKSFKAMYATSQLEATPYELRLCRLAINAYISKQREPQVVKFRAARRADTDRIEMFPSDFVFSSDMWEWLDADGKAQEFEVRI